ncbi:hypothetical protein PENSPDRAFT_665003 [Peniophora sp. CONT]|nr:hypothetical protein PENSPDRAFT_665003 [Peniophora sp. CONT]
MDAAFTMPPAPSPTKDTSLFKGVPVEARVTRRMSALPSRTTALGRSSTLKVSSSANMPSTLVDPTASVPTHMLVRVPSSSQGVQPSHEPSPQTFPADDERTRRRRRRHSEHPTNAPPRRASPPELPSKRPGTADSDFTHSMPSGPAPQRPQRHPTLHLHDVDEAIAPKEARPRRWAETPGAASVAAWVADQQVQSQFQFAPIPPTPLAPAPKTQSGLLGKVKKLVTKK